MLKLLYNKLVHHRWDLGFIDSSIVDVLNGKGFKVNYVKYPFHGRWFADPFILDFDDEEIILLVEDYSDSDKKGKISKLVIDSKSLKLKNVKKSILQLYQV